jgi:hypothetical protein
LALLLLAIRRPLDRHAPEREPCPFCAELILPEARVCPFCRSDLTAAEGGPTFRERMQR